VIKIILGIIFAGYILYLGFLLLLFKAETGRLKTSEPMSDSMANKLKEIKTRHHDKKEFLERAFEVVVGRFRSERFSLLKNPLRAGYTDVKTVWENRNALACSEQNSVLVLLLLRSLRFKESEIRRKTTFLNGLLHQYLCVYVNGSWIDVDPWCAEFKIRFGMHGWLFA